MTASAHRRPRRLLLPAGLALASVASLLAWLTPVSGASPSSRDACRTVGDGMPRGDCGPFRQVFAEDFNRDSVPLGSFSNCEHDVDTRQAYCDGLRGAYREDWWAYPDTWKDTAKSGADGNAVRAVGGTYHPEDTVWVGPADDGDGQMHIRMWRPQDGGDVHAAAVVPKKLMGRTYGKFSERFRVSKAAPGYKSAHLWYGDGCEIDYPEQNWTDTISAFTHPCGGGEQDVFTTGARWTRWHTTSVEWTPDELRYYLDGELIGSSTRGVPSEPLSWVLQNESALYGAVPEASSSAQLDITWIAGYTYGSPASGG
ncbi:glycoside hydrolase family 16 protein [Streptomyces sp. H27-D2]|uniref:glycoside hydrolase family 16 protein n=1 Tax=Streptomyces sp. H27-D2 TaxID=3046304 RepID=UPI002DBE4B3C|nr:glycoside hydrolase family 16 protein [Streptomyces sp. H27-D2]MEC4018815.1 glycoside hydrolase family 16 protein [Streptomyces sp. H27-D2]